MNNSQLNDFLALSRAHPNGLAPFSEPLGCGGRIEVWDSGVLCIEPAVVTHDKEILKPQQTTNTAQNKDIVISCGIHGNETAPIEMCERLLADIISGNLVCAQRLLLIFGNLEGMNLAVREVEENLNRLFCGEHAKDGIYNNERRRAAKLEQYVARFYQARMGAERRHYDLHTALRASKYEQFAVYPYREVHTYSRDLLAFLAAADINTILLSHVPAPTFSCFSACQFDALSLTIELGKAMPFGQNEPQRLNRLQQCLAHELANRTWQPAPLVPAELNVFQVTQEILKNTSQFVFNFSDTVANFSQFPPGGLLAEDVDRQWIVGNQTEVVVFPNAQVALGHRAALMATVINLTDKILF